MKDTLCKALSRKFIALILLTAVGTAVDLMTARGLSSNLLQLLMFLAGIYTAGNGVEHVVNRLKNKDVVSSQTVNEESSDVYLEYLKALVESGKVNQQALSEILNRLGLKK